MREVTALEAWLVVRPEVVDRLKREIAAADERSIWHAESMDAGDISEFGDMMANLERLLGVDEAEALDWYAVIREAEGST